MKSTLIQIGLCAVVLTVGAAAVAALVGTRTKVEAEPTPERLPLVGVTEVRLVPTTLTVESQGTVTAALPATIAAEIAGRVASVAAAVEPGVLVRAGEVLFELDRRDLEIVRTSALAAVAEARAMLDREQAESAAARRDLEAAGVDEPSPLARREPQLAMARAAFNSAEAALDKAELDLERATLRAPFDALVRSRMVEVGQVVGPGTVLAQLVGTAAFEVSLPLSAADVEHLDPLGVGAIDGPTVELRADADGRPARFTAQVARTAAELDPRSRSLDVVLRVDDPLTQGAAPLRLGSYVRATIDGRSVADAALLPAEVLRGPDEVWVVDDDSRLHRRRVQIAQRRAEQVVIEAGLADGDRVVTTDLDLVVDGMSVVVDQSASGARD